MKVQIHVETVTVFAHEVEVDSLAEATELPVAQFTPAVEVDDNEALLHNESRIVGVICLEA